jgi:hypothetical protein
MKHQNSNHAKTLLEQIVNVSAISPVVNIGKNDPETALERLTFFVGIIPVPITPTASAPKTAETRGVTTFTRVF